ncbi:hypothetical protein [Dyadobacter sp. NIV53]|nr:hypothetical protein [Dyadobacter sp. NIV53]
MNENTIIQNDNISVKYHISALNNLTASRVKHVAIPSNSGELKYNG